MTYEEKQQRCPYCDGHGWIVRRGKETERCMMCNPSFSKAWATLITIVVTALLLLFLSSCGPAATLKRAHKRYEKQIRKAIDQGAKVDTFKTVKYDSLRSQELHHSFTMQLEVHPNIIVQECIQLQAAKTTKQRNKAIREIQKSLCPETKLDSVYQLNVRSNMGNFLLPVHIRFETTEGKLSYSLDVSKASIPFKAETNKVEVSAGYTLWNMIIAFIIGAACGIVFYVLYLRKRVGSGS